MEVSHFSPAKESFRRNYSQDLVFGTADIPVAMGFEAGFSPTGNTEIFLNFRRINHHLQLNKDIGFTLMPATLGIRYYLDELGSLRPYFGSGFEFSWARFSSQYVVTGVNGPDPLGIIDETNNYFGYGLNLHIGLDLPVGNSTSLGIAANYNVNKLGSVEDGGLGDAGGYLFVGRMSVRL